MTNLSLSHKLSKHKKGLPNLVPHGDLNPQTGEKFCFFYSWVSER